ncbi:hypothetical protein B0H13DRAFT_1908852 [Mycena leptocephala]|nr:hypothetical protein B0H13DRAFT_1908852 [Mycena leptocephala]
MAHHRLNVIWAKYTISPDPLSGAPSLHDACSALSRHSLQPMDIVLHGAGFILHPDLAQRVLDVCTQMDLLLRPAARHHFGQSSFYIGSNLPQLLTGTLGFDLRAPQHQIISEWILLLDHLETAMHELKNYCIGDPCAHSRLEWSPPYARLVATLSPLLQRKLRPCNFAAFSIPVPLDLSEAMERTCTSAAVTSTEDGHSDSEVTDVGSQQPAHDVAETVLPAADSISDPEDGKVPAHTPKVATPSAVKDPLHAIESGGLKADLDSPAHLSLRYARLALLLHLLLLLRILPDSFSPEIPPGWLGEQLGVAYLLEVRSIVIRNRGLVSAREYEGLDGKDEERVELSTIDQDTTLLTSKGFVYALEPSMLPPCASDLTLPPGLVCTESIRPCIQPHLQDHIGLEHSLPSSKSLAPASAIADAVELGGLEELVMEEPKCDADATDQQVPGGQEDQQSRSTSIAKQRDDENTHQFRPADMTAGHESFARVTVDEDAVEHTLGKWVYAPLQPPVPVVVDGPAVGLGGREVDTLAPARARNVPGITTRVELGGLKISFSNEEKLTIAAEAHTGKPANTSRILSFPSLSHHPPLVSLSTMGFGTFALVSATIWTRSVPDLACDCFPPLTFGSSYLPGPSAQRFIAHDGPKQPNSTRMEMSLRIHHRDGVGAGSTIASPFGAAFTGHLAYGWRVINSRVRCCRIELSVDECPQVEEWKADLVWF